MCMCLDRISREMMDVQPHMGKGMWVDQGCDQGSLE